VRCRFPCATRLLFEKTGFRPKVPRRRARKRFAGHTALVSQRVERGAQRSFTHRLFDAADVCLRLRADFPAPKRAAKERGGSGQPKAKLRQRRAVSPACSPYLSAQTTCQHLSQGRPLKQGRVRALRLCLGCLRPRSGELPLALQKRQRVFLRALFYATLGYLICALLRALGLLRSSAKQLACSFHRGLLAPVVPVVKARGFFPRRNTISDRVFSERRSGALVSLHCRKNILRPYGLTGLERLSSSCRYLARTSNDLLHSCSHPPPCARRGFG